MKKLFIATVLCLSFVGISAAQEAKEETPWYASFKKLYASGVCLSTANYIISLTAQQILLPRSVSVGRRITYLQEEIRELPTKMLNISTLHIIPALVISSAGKMIHKRSKKKQLSTGL